MTTSKHPSNGSGTVLGAAVGRGAAAGAATLASLFLVVALMASPAVGDPPGNNGTVKIDGVEMDSVPNNGPHQGGAFTVTFAGYDKGALTATVDFELRPPTLRLTGSQVLVHDTIFIGEDEAGGANDLDAQRTYTLDFNGVIPHLTQGYHVRLTVHAGGSQGSDVKHKLFWIKPGTGPTTTSTTSTTATTSTSTTPTTPSVPTTRGTAASPTTAPAAVLGAVYTPPGGAGIPGTIEELPRTGSSTRTLLALAALLILLGDATLLGLRTRQPGVT